MSTISYEQAVRWVRTGQWDELSAALHEQPELASIQDETGRTLLIICAAYGGSSQVIRALVAFGANPNHQAFDGSTALAAAIVGDSRHGLRTLPEFKTLLELGADPNMNADAGMPALHWAIAQNNLEFAEYLLEHGADMKGLTSDSPPESAEDVARRMGSLDALQLLKEHQERKRRGSQSR